MPEEVLDAGKSDALFETPEATAPAETQAPPEQAQPAESAPEEGSQQPPQGIQDGTAALAGTPFKSVAALVDGYKNLQRFAASRDRELKEVQQTVRQIALQMKQQTEAAPKPSPEEFFQKFTTDPFSTLESHVKEAVQRALNERIGKIEQQQQAIGTDREIDTFVKSHPELTTQDEQAIVQVLEAKPQLKNLPDRLELAYAYVYRMNAMQKAQAAKQAQAVSGAKSAAGLGGKPSALKVPTGGDEFDDVIADYKAHRELFSR